jgi:A/G-specific adenine glycosylase
VKKSRLIAGLLSKSQQRRFSRSLLNWYDAHRRHLPWRASPDPYRVWLSEIMLQQTRVAAVIEHYHEFLRRFPTIEKLAAAREASVLAGWSGLGYYRRARMLHAAAKVVVHEHGGKFPETEVGLRALPGIGRYTAAAIASIAFGEPVAVVDGNVERVLQRLDGKRLADEELWRTANHLLDAKRPGDFNQAMMELGATVCTPKAPLCLTCPVLELCATRGELAAQTKAQPQLKREIHYSLHCRKREIFLVQRPPDASLMPGMWEFPELATMNSASMTDTRTTDAKTTDTKMTEAKTNGARPSFTLRHSITVTDYTVQVWRDGVASHIEGKWISLGRLKKLPLTGLARKILRQAEIL